MNRLFGMETEYAFTAHGPSGQVLERGGLVEQMERLAAQLHPSVPGFRSAGLFTANGSRLYRDPAGNFTHLELAGPECANPWDVVRYLQAGEQMLVELASELVRVNPLVRRATFYKSNVDYLAGTTWGCHESYLTSQRISTVSPQLIPHLVSRLVVTGAGGFDTRTPGIEFLLSPRVAHLTIVESNGSQFERPIFHTRDEPLSRQHRRLHVICGESLCSEHSAWLKVACTALVVALIDAELQPGDAVRLDDPLAAMRAFAGDPFCGATARLAGGGDVSALAIQRHYLGLAAEHQRSCFMPPWAPEAVAAWGAMLDRLERGPSAVGRTLDWAIKLRWFREFAARRGFDWDQLPQWNIAMARLRAAAQRADPQEPRFAGELVPGTSIPVTEAVRAVLADPPGPGLAWSQLPGLLQLRRELFELDWRYAQLGPGNLFASLEQAGLLEHRFAGVDNLEHALRHPPDFGRARVRGRVIQRVTHVRQRFACDWTSLWDLDNWMMLDLADPFAEEERWENMAHLRPPTPAPPGQAGQEPLTTPSS